DGRGEGGRELLGHVLSLQEERPNRREPHPQRGDIAPYQAMVRKEVSDFSPLDLRPVAWRSAATLLSPCHEKDYTAAVSPGGNRRCWSRINRPAVEGTAVGPE